MELVKRKENRLKGYKYDRNGAYFITICAEGKKKILSKITSNTIKNVDIVGATSGRQYNVCLTRYGEVIEKFTLSINKQYPMVNVDKYVIMPNHIHLMLIICCDNGRAMHAPYNKIFDFVSSFFSLRQRR